MDTTKKPRLYGLDILRLLSFIAISIHHFIWVVWYTRDVPPSQVSSLWLVVETFARAISFSGHTILFLTSFLIARSETRPAKTWQVVGFVAAGWVLFCLFEYGQNPVFWIWDIYPLIMLGLATGLLFARASKPLVYAAGAAGVLMTLIPFWEWEWAKALPLQWRHWLIGDCDADLADWPILPWVGFMWFGYALGTYERVSYEKREKNPLWSWWRFEFIMWPAVLVAAIPNLGAFYNIPLGNMFACFSFRQTPLVFWSHFIYVLFLWRVSLLENVRRALAQNRGALWVGGLAVSRRFGIAYLLQYCLIEVEARFFREVIDTSWVTSLIAVVTLVPITELTVRALEKTFGIIRSRRGGPSEPSA